MVRLAEMPNLKLNHGKGWGHKREDLEMPFATRETPENPLTNTLIYIKSRPFQEIFMAHLDCAPTLCHPLIESLSTGGEEPKFCLDKLSLSPSAP